MLSYNKVKLNGFYTNSTPDSKTYTDYLWIKNKVDTREEIDSTLGFTYDPIWDFNTLFLAPFTENINGGDVSSVLDKITKWQVYKKKVDDSVLTFITETPSFQLYTSDFGVLNNETYQYTVFGETDNYISAPIEQQGWTTTNWWDWSLIGLEESDNKDTYYVDNENIWIFDTDLSSNSLSQNLDKYTFNNFTKFPKISSGKRNYINGSITTLLGNVNQYNVEYKDTVDMVIRFREFIGSNKLKLLRDRKGLGYVVETTANSFQIKDNTDKQIVQISFDFVQVGEFNDIKVVRRQ